jgi:UDP-2,3-diacylglucosamine pyrophosphatase LpxH
MDISRKTIKRPLKAVVISDVHLGAYACKADQLTTYLKSIKPKILVLNGDIIDVWQFSRRYFPAPHMKLVRQIIKMMEHGTQIIYIAGNHDEVLRRFAGISLGSFSIVNKVVLTLDGEKTWIFHGDVFDGGVHRIKWLAKLGAHGYAILTLVNKMFDVFTSWFGVKRKSLSKKVQTRVEGSSKAVSIFEKTVAELAIRKGYKYAICGHIHRPEKKEITTDKGSVTYLNSGDWVENFTALEYAGKDWKLKYWDSTEDKTIHETFADEPFIKPYKDLFLKVYKEVVGS